MAPQVPRKLGNVLKRCFSALPPGEAGTPKARRMRVEDWTKTGDPQPAPLQTTAPPSPRRERDSLTVSHSRKSFDPSLSRIFRKSSPTKRSEEHTSELQSPYDL